MNIAQLPIGEKAPEIVNVVIEIIRGCRNKYEYDEKLDAFLLDRVNFVNVVYPFDYGFIPETRCDDGDHLDALVIMDEPTFTGCVIPARPIGLMKMIDNGEADEKLICVPAKDARYAHVTELDQLSPHLPKEIQHFFEHYKDLQGKTVSIEGWADATAAKEMVKTAQASHS